MFWTITCLTQSLAMVARSAFFLPRAFDGLPADFHMGRAGVVD